MSDLFKGPYHDNVMKLYPPYDPRRDKKKKVEPRQLFPTQEELDEYELIKQKKSKLSATKRRELVEKVDRLRGYKG